MMVNEYELVMVFILLPARWREYENGKIEELCVILVINGITLAANQ
jgi:hypothetical protein